MKMHQMWHAHPEGVVLQGLEDQGCSVELQGSHAEWGEDGAELKQIRVVADLGRRHCL